MRWGAPRVFTITALLVVGSGVVTTEAVGRDEHRPGVKEPHLAAPQEPVPREPVPVVVASKPFGESYVLAEVFAQVLEARGVAVDRRPGLGATEIAFQALRSGAIDLYPEYTGTGLLAVLGEAPQGSAGAVYRRVAEAFRERWDLRWLPTLGFENTYAVAVRRATADSLGLATLSDLARVGGELSGGSAPTSWDAPTACLASRGPTVWRSPRCVRSSRR